jgi:hypothetical protein
MSEKSSDTGAFLAGFVIGGLVGTAIALILAPSSGEEMRHQLAERGQGLRRSGSEWPTPPLNGGVSGEAGTVLNGDAGRTNGAVTEAQRIILSDGTKPPVENGNAQNSAEIDAND